MKKEQFTITGMTCTACSSGIERALRKLNGIESADVSLLGESLSVCYREEDITQEKIWDTVRGLGYGISQYDASKQVKARPQSAVLKVRFFLSLIFLIPLLYFSMGEMLSLPQPPAKISGFMQALLTLAILVINFKFFSNGTKTLVRGLPNMDTLVSLGAGVSYIYSIVLLVLVFLGKMHHVHFFFESAGMILTLVTLGKWLEEISKRKTGNEIEKLIKLMPNTVTIELDGKEKNIEFSEIQVGDILVVKQGEYVPVDGVIAEGGGYVDRSALTGESMPIEVQVGDKVTGADTVKSGFMKIKAEKVGADTALSQIVKMVKEAGASKAPLQKVADKISGVFVPVVTLLAIITFSVWLAISKDFSTAINYGVSVLVISCPCALGLATPVAVMTATGKAMSMGILFKDAETLQRTKEINCVMLDKTATLTEGKPKVTDFACFIGEERFALQMALAMEKRSNHPIAECIQAFAQEQLQTEDALEITDYAYNVGKGATATYQGKTYALGNRKWLGEDKKAYALEKEYAKAGKTAIFLTENKKCIAVFALADTLKAESKQAVQDLKSRNIRLGMLTGDNENVAKAIATEVGISDYFAEALPKDKAEAVGRVQSVGGIVAMVGDGINDSPALKASDIGIAMGNGTDVAMDSADIVLSVDDLRLVGTAIDLSKATVRNIKQNLFWAFFYNCISIPVASGVFASLGVSLNPMICALAMSLSSLFVVTNALRLMRFGKNKNKVNKEETKMKKTLKIEGMMCQHCVAHVTKALQAIDGVVNVDVNLKKKTATVEMGLEIADQTFISAISEAGYEVKKIS